MLFFSCQFGFDYMKQKNSSISNDQVMSYQILGKALVCFYKSGSMWNHIIQLWKVSLTSPVKSPSEGQMAAVSSRCCRKHRGS